MLTVHEIENMRRSAAMSPLSIEDQRRLLEACAEMARQRTEIARVLAGLPTSWASVRSALNELQQIVTPHQEASPRRKV